MRVDAVVPVRMAMDTMMTRASTRTLKQSNIAHARYSRPPPFKRSPCPIRRQYAQSTNEGVNVVPKRLPDTKESPESSARDSRFPVRADGNLQQTEQAPSTRRRPPSTSPSSSEFIHKYSNRSVGCYISASSNDVRVRANPHHRDRARIRNQEHLPLLLSNLHPMLDINAALLLHFR